VNILSNNSSANKQSTNLIDDFSNIFGNPTTNQNLNNQNNFTNIFSMDSNPVISNINEPIKNNNFDLLSGFLNMESNKTANNQNQIGLNLLGNTNTGTAAPSSNSNDLLNNLGLVIYLLIILNF